MVPPSKKLLGRLEFESPAGVVLGDRRIRLLEAIVAHGSLNRAAKAVPLSYKAAWDALDAMNQLSPEPLVVRTTGGRNGGGTTLTEHGLRLVALYRALESSQQDLLDRVSSPRALAAAAADEGGSLRALLRRMSMRTSARNQFFGTVTSVADTGGMADVTLRLEGGEALVASITPESVATMALGPGSAAYALVKAPWVAISAAAPRPSAQRNRFEGVLEKVEPGRQRSQLSLVTPSGRAIAAAMPKEEVAARGLKAGARAWAAFATESVILASFD